MPRPEILAPAGDLETLRAALAAGADAVYFGLDDGFNARARARNFSRENLAEVVAEVHRARARAYVTLNTLLFQPELPAVEAILRDVAAAGVDAIIVQDPAVAMLARAVCPDLELHASTQMTVSSAEAGRLVETLGFTRVVLPRELSVEEIARFGAGSALEMEVFVHGALCMSWSGQCLTSEAWGGRSANRGQCAQSCRLPYDLVVDDEVRELGDVRYLLSPRDLAGLRAAPRLAEMGVASLKIEGRYKGPAYVVSAVQGWRRWLDAIEAGGEAGPSADARKQLARDLLDMSLSFSRGFGDGFLAGSDHQTLVDGRHPRHRGAWLGRVVRIEGGGVLVQTGGEANPSSGGAGLSAPGAPDGRVSAPLPPTGGDADAATGAPAAPIQIQPGMGVVFDAGRPDEEEPGGAVFGVEARSGGRVWLRFGRAAEDRGARSGVQKARRGARGRIAGERGERTRGGPDLSRISPGDRVWVTGDPATASRLKKEGERDPEGRIPLRLIASGAAGAPLQITAEALDRRGRIVARAAAEAEIALAPARGGGVDAALLRDKLGSLGGTPFTLAALDAGGLAPGVHLPVSKLKALRRALVAELTPQIERGAARAIAPGPVLPALLADNRARLERVGVRPGSEGIAPGAAPVELIPLCRDADQLEAVIDAGLPEVELDWMDMVGLGRAVSRAREAGLRVTVATVRVQKPGEEGYDRRIERLAPDAVLVRHWGALTHFLERSAAGPGARAPALRGDFSLNVTNALTAAWLLERGLESVTASHDLDADQLDALLAEAPAGRVDVTIHHHIPTFHTEHCVYAHTLSNGRDYRSCGRPCDHHEIGLRDPDGRVHPVVPDVGCRNTVFNAQAQSAAGLVSRLRSRGVRRMRIEFVRETRAEASAVLAAYRGLLDGALSPAGLRRSVGVHEQFGVTRGTMEVIGR